ncbi:MAG: ral secretion pathway protein [Candidatus Binatota bacterium]|jgi:general secretion pathway protein C|nr:ral secretion pathway protein [Candidatus Binatota bacterium]
MIPPRTLVIAGQLLLLALAAFFAASSVNAGISIALRPKVEVSLPPVEANAPAMSKRPISHYAAVTERDIFNPPKPVEETAPAPTVSPLKAKLLGTAPGHGMDSFAIIEDESDRKQELYRVGDRLQDRTVSRIEWDHVILKNGSQEETLKLAEQAGRPGSFAAAAAEEGIQKLGETSFVVDRSEVDQAMENMNQVFTQIRAVPHFQDGKASGFRVFAIRRDSIFDKIGLKNGDVIARINGQELSDPARAMSMIQELRSSTNVSVEVMRNRQPTTLSYEIR